MKIKIIINIFEKYYIINLVIIMKINLKKIFIYFYYLSNLFLTQLQISFFSYFHKLFFISSFLDI